MILYPTEIYTDQGIAQSSKPLRLKKSFIGLEN